jgi:hypothetical protein
MTKCCFRTIEGEIGSVKTDRLESRRHPAEWSSAPPERVRRAHDHGRFLRLPHSGTYITSVEIE